MAFKLRNPFAARTVDTASPELMEQKGPNDLDGDADGARKSVSIAVKDRLAGPDTMKQDAGGASGGDAGSDGSPDEMAASPMKLSRGLKSKTYSNQPNDRLGHEDDPAGAAGDGSGDASPEVVQHNESALEFRQAAGINTTKSDISLGRHSDLGTRGTVGDISLKRTGGEAPAGGTPATVPAAALTGSPAADFRTGGEAPAGDGEPGDPSEMEKGTVKFFNEKKGMADGADDAQAERTGPIRIDNTPARAAGEDGGGAPEAAINTSHSGIKNMAATEPTGDAPGSADALRHDTVKTSKLGDSRRETGPSAPVEGKPTKDQVAGESDASAGGGASGADRISTKEPTKVEFPNRTAALPEDAGSGGPGDPSDDAAGDGSAAGGGSGGAATQASVVGSADRVGDSQGRHSVDFDAAQAETGMTKEGPLAAGDPGGGGPEAKVSMHDDRMTEGTLADADPGGGAPEAKVHMQDVQVALSSNASKEGPLADDDVASTSAPVSEDSTRALPPTEVAKFGMVSGGHRDDASKEGSADDGMTRSSDAVAAEDDSPEAATIGHEATHTAQSSSRFYTSRDGEFHARTDGDPGGGAPEATASMQDFPRPGPSPIAPEVMREGGVTTGSGSDEQTRKFQTLSNASKEGDMTRSGDAAAAEDDSPEAATIGHEATHTLQQRAQAATPLAASLRSDAGAGAAASDGDTAPEDLRANWTSSNPGIATAKAVGEKDRGEQLTAGEARRDGYDVKKNEGRRTEEAGGEGGSSDDGGPQEAAAGSVLSPRDAPSGMAAGKAVGEKDHGSQVAAGRSIPENSVEGSESEPDAIGLTFSNDKEGVVSTRAAGESPEPGGIAVSDDGGPQVAAAGEQKKWLPANFRTAAVDPDDDEPSTLLDLSSVDESGAVAPIGDPDFDLLEAAGDLDADNDADGIDVDPDTDADAVDFKEALILD